MFNKLCIPPETTKLFVTISNDKWLRYYFGQFDIYIASVKPIITHGTQFNRPTILTIKYNNDSELTSALDDINIDITARRIFKSEVLPLKMKGKVDKFIHNCAKNFLHLVSGNSVKVLCKDNRELQKRFYDTFVKVNEEEKTKCTFDYDNYINEFVIKEYTVGNKYTLVTFADGLDVEGN